MTAPRPVRHVTETFRAADGVALALHRWTPNEQGPDDGATLGTCLLVHGYAEHALRYGPLAEALVAVGIEVVAPDLRGHGASPGVRGDVPSFEVVAGDVAELLRDVRSAARARPIVLFGHSLGGAIALSVALDEQASLAGLVLSAPFLRSAEKVSGLLVGVARVLSKLVPTLPLRSMDAGLVSRDPAVVATYRSDPWVYNGRVRARMGYELVRSGPSLLARAPQLRLPLLVLHGDADGLADLTASRELAAAVGSDDLTLEVVAGGYHELLNDLGRERTTQRVVTWMRDHLAADSRA